ncbi:LON peptidase substrate-binding domain-containing protein [Nakamurella sp. A5-74]|uniref:LON peptidase substrate-binding domain-containing protein n=1 Tax=Nakamurella sp. A5-74 TaxID=3158264 RepID=A0AAU8DMG4_9ACTN
MTLLPMFPLGSVLLPAMPLALRVFEPRYLEMMVDVLAQEPAEFGVVLIERGQEVGGGDRRFGIGTVARVTEIEEGDGVVGLIARGASRIEVIAWQAEDPYPRAEVRKLPALIWTEQCRTSLVEADRLVRTALALASEFVEASWSSDIALADEPGDLVWQLAGITPVGLIDRLAFLRAGTTEELLSMLIAETTGAVQALRAGWSLGGLG